MSLIGDGLDAAVQKAFTRPAPKNAGPQMRYLVKQLGGTKAVAQMLRVSQRTVERYVKDQIKKPRPDLAARMEREVKARWQPQIRAKAKQKAAATGGIIIDTRARLGYTAPIGSTDQDRISTSRTAAAAPAPWTRSASPTSNTSSSTCSSRAPNSRQAPTCGRRPDGPVASSGGEVVLGAFPWSVADHFLQGKGGPDRAGAVVSHVCAECLGATSVLSR